MKKNTKSILIVTVVVGITLVTICPGGLYGFTNGDQWLIVDEYGTKIATSAGKIIALDEEDFSQYPVLYALIMDPSMSFTVSDNSIVVLKIRLSGSSRGTYADKYA